jgi:hypothetical protein
MTPAPIPHPARHNLASSARSVPTGPARITPAPALAGRLVRRTPDFLVRPATTAPATPGRVGGREVAASFPEAAPTGPARRTNHLGTGDTRKTAEAKA